MGAGISQKTMNGYYYRSLKRIQRELAAVGVTAQYKAYRLWYVDPAEGSNAKGFGVSYRTIRASNGETAGIPIVWIRHQGVSESFEEFSGAGIQRIKELFGRAS